MLKNLCALLLAVVMIITMFTACGDVKPNEPTVTQPEVNESVDSEPQGNVVTEDEETTADIEEETGVSLPEYVPYGTYTSADGNYTIEFSDYDVDNEIGAVKFTEADGVENAYATEAAYYILKPNEDSDDGSVKPDYVYIKIKETTREDLEFGYIPHLIFYFNDDILQETVNSIALGKAIERSGSAYHNNRRYICYYKNGNVDTTNEKYPEPGKSIFYAFTEFDDHNYVHVPYDYIYTDDVVLMSSENKSNTEKTHTYIYNNGDYVTDDFVLEYKVIDYENMAGLITAWTFPVIPFEEYSEWCYLIDLQIGLPYTVVKYVSSNTINGEGPNVTIDLRRTFDEASGEGFYFNGVPITDKNTIADILGEYSYAAFSVTETISYVNGEYISSFGMPTLNYKHWVFDDFELAIGNYFMYIYARSEF